MSKKRGDGIEASEHRFEQPDRDGSLIRSDPFIFSYLFKLIYISGVLPIVILLILPMISTAVLIDNDQDGIAERYQPGQILVGIIPEKGTTQLQTTAHQNLLSRDLPQSLQALVAANPILSAQMIMPGNIATKTRNSKTESTTPTIYRLTLADSSTDLRSLCEELNKNAEIEFAEPNYILDYDDMPNDPYLLSSGSWGQDYADQWGLYTANVTQAWDLAGLTQQVIVAVVDTGLRIDHPDIISNVWNNPGEISGNGIDDDGNGYIDDCHGWDFADDTANITDTHGHGTSVAGIIAATKNNGIGMAGIAANVQIMAVKNGSGSSDVADSVAAIRYAADSGAQIINMSFGGSTPSATLSNAMEYAAGLGAVLFAAAGNDGSVAEMHYPADYGVVISVGSTDHENNRSEFSTYSSLVDIMAPGGDSTESDILSLRGQNTTSGTALNSNYVRTRGTSFSSPFAAGVAALMLGRTPALSREEIRHILQATSDDIMSPGWDIDTKYGLINACQALQRQSALTPHISYPPAGAGQIYSGTLTIKGDITGTNLVEASVEYSSTEASEQWTLLATFTNTVQNQTLTTWDTSTNNSGTYQLRIRARDIFNNEYEDRVEIIVSNFDPPQRSGWPQNGSFPSVADIDNDGTLEILTPSSLYLRIYHDDGTPVPGWPKSIGAAAVGPASVADLDNDGDLEIAAIGNSSGSRTGSIGIWHHDGTPISGWPKSFTSGNPFISYTISPVLIDVNADGTNDIIYCSNTGPYSGAGIIHIEQLDGNPLPGWPVTLRGYSSDIMTTPCTGDIDGDGLLEISAIAFDGQVVLYNHDGSAVQGWPVKLGDGSNPSGSTTMADVDNDGELEIIATTYGGDTAIYEANAAIMPGWPQDIGSIPRPPAVADLDGDGELEIAFGTQDGLVAIYHHDGSNLTGWPKSLPSRGYTPALVDINSDHRPDIIASCGNCTLHGWTAEGTTLYEYGFPADLNGSNGGGPPVVADLDGNGTLEVVVFSSSNTEVRNLTATNNPDCSPFTMMHVNKQQSGIYAPRQQILDCSPHYIQTEYPGAGTGTITGKNFLKGTEAVLGSYPATITAVQATHLDITLPSTLTNGWYDLTLRQADSGTTTLTNGIVVFSSNNGDDDSDGMENLWECSNHLDPHDNGSVNPDNGPNGDPDGDRLKNAEEFIAGTAANDATDVLRIHTALTNQSSDTEPLFLCFSWNTKTGRYYSLKYCTSLLQTNWETVPNWQDIPGTDQIVTFTNVPSQNNLFFRIDVRLD